MNVQEVPLAKVEVSALNTRKNLDGGQEDSSIEDLARSIAEKGLLNPVTVRGRPDGTFELIAGQRRFLACKKLGLRTISAIVRDDLDDNSATVVSLVENIHRADMAPMDKARAFAALLRNYGGDMQRVSKESGFTAATIRKYLVLNDLPPELQAKVSTYEGSAKIDALNALARTFDDPAEMVEAYEKISGFRQQVQLEILKRSGGNLQTLEELRESAVEGAFDLKLFKHESIYDCPFIPKPLLPAIAEVVEQYAKDVEAGKPEKESLKKAIARLRKDSL